MVGSIKLGVKGVKGLIRNLFKGQILGKFRARVWGKKNWRNGYVEGYSNYKGKWVKVAGENFRTSLSGCYLHILGAYYIHYWNSVAQTGLNLSENGVTNKSPSL